MYPPMNGTEQRLDRILEELKALRQRLEEKPEAPADPDAPIALREPAKPRGRPKKQQNES